MRNLLALAALLLLTVAAVGWYLGWYRVQTEPAADGHRQVTIDINGKKVGQDLKRGEEKIHTLVQNQTPPPAPAQPAAPVPSDRIPPPPPPPGSANTAQSQPGWSHPEESYPVSSDLIPPPPPPAQ